MTANRVAIGRDDMQRTISPVDGRIYAERRLARDDDIRAALERATAVQRDWQREPVESRARQVTAFVDAFVAGRDAIALELSWQMGRPIRHAPGEVRGFEERARGMIDIAPQALADLDAGAEAGLDPSLQMVSK